MLPGAPAPQPDAAARRRKPPAPGLAELFAALPVAVALIDPDDCVRFANPACEALLNLSERAMLGVRLDAVLTPPPGAGNSEGRAVAAFDHDAGTDRTRRLRIDYHEAAVSDRKSVV